MPNYWADEQKGFTLIELLITIAVIAILAAVAFVALDPLTRFRDSRDAARWSDISAILSAIKVDQVDNGGSYLAAITQNGQAYMIGTDVTGCNGYTCDASVTSTANCIDLAGLVTEGYLGEVPISPDGASSWTVGHTGYVLTAKNSGIVTIQSCESENTSDIQVSR